MKILIVASDKGGHFVPFIEEQIAALQVTGVQIVRYAIKGKGILGYLHELPALKRMIRAERPDIVHAHFGLSGLLANLQRLVPVVTTYHGSDINVPKILRLSRIAMRLSAWNIFVSKRNVEIAFGCSDNNTSRLKKRSTLLPCGINLTDDQLTSREAARNALGIGLDEKIILFAGAFDNKVKDAELAFAALKKTNDYILKQQHQQLDPTNNRANQLPCAAKEIRLVELKGYSRKQVNLLMCAANALLMTSKTEGSPQVIKEAMACGCPIVSVDVGDVAERTSGVEGCYVVPSREPAAIAEALQQAIAFEGRTNGRERIIEMGLTNKQVAERLMAIYKSLV